MPKFIKASYNEKMQTVEYVADNGDRLLRSGGTIAWRFNNPGNLRPGPNYKLHIGQGHTLSGPFLIFPTPEEGRAEKRGLLLRKYKSNSISTMLYTYAPPKENDTEGYIKNVCKKTGLSREKIIEQLSDDDLKKLMAAMEEHEGYHHKTETRKENWIRTTTVNFSDGAKPLANFPVKIKRNGKEVTAKTNIYGQLAPFVHYKPGDTLELWVEDIKKDWKKLETLTLGEISGAYTYVRDLLVAHAHTGQHNPVIKAAEKPPAFRYVVQPGDTLSKIANKFKIEADKIQKDNGIKNQNKIMAGQVLIIQKANSPNHISNAAPPAHTSQPSRNTNTSFSKTTTPERSKEGQGHPIALIPVDQKRAPWMEYAISEAKRWRGKKEAEITKEHNYHKEIKQDGNLINTPWCASFVNYCFNMAGYPMSASRSWARSFIRDKNFRQIDALIYGALAVYGYHGTDPKKSFQGHVAFVHSLDEKSGREIVLGGNQSDSICFRLGSIFESPGINLKLIGYFVPSSYYEFALNEIKDGVHLDQSTQRELNQLFGIQSNSSGGTR